MYVHTHTHIRLLGRYSRVRDAHGPQGRAMLHRELHYVYAHSSHCAPFSSTLSFYLSLSPSLSFFLILYPFIFMHMFFSIVEPPSHSDFFYIVFLASYCISGATLIFFAASRPTLAYRFYFSPASVDLFVLFRLLQKVNLHSSKMHILIIINK